MIKVIHYQKSSNWIENDDLTDYESKYVLHITIFVSLCSAQLKIRDKKTDEFPFEILYFS